MADSPETKVLKDINRHLGSIDQKASGGTGPAGAEGTADKTKALRAMSEMLGNFESLMEVKLKKLTLTTDRSFNQAFGNLKGFNEAQTDAMISELDNVIDKLEIQNRHLKSSDDLEFLKEQERAEDLQVNKKTNEILEDILEKEPGDGGDGGTGMGLGGLGPLGAIGAGLGLKKLLTAGGLLKLGKIAGVGLLGGALFKSFLDGFSEGMENDKKSFAARLVSGLGQVFEDYSFGIFSKEDIEGAGEKFRRAASKAGADIQSAWDKYWRGGAPLSDALAESLSGLALGTLSPEVIKTIGSQFKFFAEETGETFWRTIFGAAGFKLKDPLTFEQKKAVEENARLRKERIKKAKMRDRNVLQVERAMAKANIDFERRAEIREALGGKFSFMTTDEEKEMSGRFGQDAESAAKESGRRARLRVQYIETLLAGFDRKEKEKERKKEIREMKRLQAEKKENDAKLLAEKKLKEKAELEKANKDAIALTERLKAEGDSPPPSVFTQQNNNTYQDTDIKVETDDVNWYRSDGLR